MSRFKTTAGTAARQSGSWRDKPFVNIRFNYSIFGRMWDIVWRDAEASWRRKLLCLVFIVLLAPVMFVGLPFVIAEKSRGRSG